MKYLLNIIMRKAIFSLRVRRIIKNFTAYRAAYFERVYSDTGIFWEETIIDRYISESDDLSDIFIDRIIHDIELGVLGVIYNTEWEMQYSRLVTKTGSHILIVWIRRVIWEDDIFVEDLEIQT